MCSSLWVLGSCVDGVVFRFWRWYVLLFLFFVPYSCSWVFIWFVLEQRQDQRQRTQANQTQQIETTSKNKGQRTNNKNKEQYQTPKKKHKFKEQNKK